MQTINVNKADATSIESARNAAVSAVRDDINDPVVMSWHDRQENTFAPDIPGGDPETRWEDYGESMGRTHKVLVSDRYELVVCDATGFTEPKPALKNFTDDQGREYFCISASCSDETRRPLDEAYPAGGGIGDG
jgi:hypothetical protein